MRKIIGLLCFAIAARATPLAAQTWNADQQALWKVEEMQWKMSAAKDASWIPLLVHPNMSAWSNDMPSPQSYASLVKWEKLQDAESTTLEHEIYPIAITITNNVGVVQYRYHSATENAKKEHKAENGRWTDVLIKDGGTWKFITWAGGADPEK